MSFRRGLLCRILICAISLPIASAAADESGNFVEISGEMEFSGQMIARPIQPAVWAAQGVEDRQATARITAARDAVSAYSVIEYIWQTDEYVIDVPKGRTENEVAEALMSSGNFQYVHPNWIVYPLGCPDDSRFGNQWHHAANRLQSCDGWDLHTGNPSVSVGICDTGIRTTHEDFQLHRREGYNAVDRIWESVGGPGVVTDIHGHGTSTTGCAAANGDNGVGIAGVGWNLGHRMLKVSNVPSGVSSLTILNHAARTAIESGDKVSSVSYSGVSAATNRETATYIKSIGGLLVWAAGNDGANLDWGDRDDDDIIVVGGTNESDGRYSFSAFGRSVDLVAPAVNVFTTANSSNSGYRTATGTSLACPLTAGLCALIWSANTSLTPDEVEEILKHGVDDLGAPGIDDIFGYGRINVFGSLTLVPPSPPTFNYPNGLPDLIDPNGGTTVRVEITANGLAPLPGTGMLHTNDGSGWTSAAMQEIIDNVYDAVFPALPCGDALQFYFSTEANDGNVYSDPPFAPQGAFTTTSAFGVIPLFEDDFETDKGWVAANAGASAGDWQRGVPVNDPNYAYDPLADSDGSGRCWLTDNTLGESDVDEGAVRLTSPPIDMSAGRVTIGYDYFLRLTRPQDKNDRIIVRIRSEAGGPWTTIAVHNTDGGLGWRHHEITQADLDAAGVTLTSTMRLRFRINDAFQQSIVEGGLDAVRITALDCGGSCDPCDMNCDGDVNALDIDPFIDLLFAGGVPCNTCTGDTNGDGTINTLDIEPFLNCLFP